MLSHKPQNNRLLVLTRLITPQASSYDGWSFWLFLRYLFILKGPVIVCSTLVTWMFGACLTEGSIVLYRHRHQIGLTNYLDKTVLEANIQLS